MPSIMVDPSLEIINISSGFGGPAGVVVKAGFDFISALLEGTFAQVHRATAGGDVAGVGAVKDRLKLLGVLALTYKGQ